MRIYLEVDPVCTEASTIHYSRGALKEGAVAEFEAASMQLSGSSNGEVPGPIQGGI